MPDHPTLDLQGEVRTIYSWLTTGHQAEACQRIDHLPPLAAAAVVAGAAMLLADENRARLAPTFASWGLWFTQAQNAKGE